MSEGIISIFAKELLLACKDTLRLAENTESSRKLHPFTLFCRISEGGAIVTWMKTAAMTEVYSECGRLSGLCGIADLR